MKAKFFFILLFVTLLLISSIMPLTIAQADQIHSEEMFTVSNESKVSIVNNYTYQTYPELSNMMPVTVTTQTNQVAAGSIFFTNFGFMSSYNPGLFIVDDNGEPIFLHAGEMGKYLSDFKVQSVNGKSYLVYHVGTPHMFWSYGKYVVMDDTYTIVDEWEMKNGHRSDLHEIQLLENGDALLLAYTDVPYDLTPFGGPADGIAIDIVIQELNPAKEVVFEWHSLDHIPITELIIILLILP